MPQNPIQHTHTRPPWALQRRQLVLGAGGLLVAPWFAQAQTAAPSRAEPAEPARVLQPRPLVFARDHGTHNDTRTEWWYLTGTLATAGGPELGFQVTFFRSRVDAAAGHPSAFAARQLVFAPISNVSTSSGSKRWIGSTPKMAMPP